MSEDERKQLDALREWARIGLALYTAAMATTALFYPEQSQIPLNQRIEP